MTRVLDDHVAITRGWAPTIVASYANLAAFNRWLHDDWGYAYCDRIYGVPIRSLRRWTRRSKSSSVASPAGARVLSLKTDPVYGRSPGDPSVDPFWARVKEAELTAPPIGSLPVTMRVSAGTPSPVTSLTSQQWQSFRLRVDHGASLGA